MSQNQLLFLQVEKKRKLLIRISRILVLLGFLAIWEITARCGLIDVFFFHPEYGSAFVFQNRYF